MVEARRVESLASGRLVEGPPRGQALLRGEAPDCGTHGIPAEKAVEILVVLLQAAEEDVDQTVGVGPVQINPVIPEARIAGIDLLIFSPVVVSPEEG